MKSKNKSTRMATTVRARIGRAELIIALTIRYRLRWRI